jgi:hypothetical protein
MEGCYIWSTSLYGAGPWARRKVDRKHVESCEMWCCRRLEKNSWTDRVRSEEVGRVKEEENIVQKKQKEGRLTGLVASSVGTAF